MSGAGWPPPPSSFNAYDSSSESDSGHDLSPHEQYAVIATRANFRQQYGREANLVDIENNTGIDRSRVAQFLNDQAGSYASARDAATSSYASARDAASSSYAPARLPAPSSYAPQRRQLYPLEETPVIPGPLFNNSNRPPSDVSAEAYPSLDRRRTYSDAPRPSFSSGNGRHRYSESGGGSSGARSYYPSNGNGPQRSSGSNGGGHRHSESTGGRSYHSSLPSDERMNFIERGAMRSGLNLGDEDYDRGPSNPVLSSRDMRRNVLAAESTELRRQQQAAMSNQQAIMDAGQSARSPLTSAYRSIRDANREQEVSNPRFRALATVATNFLRISNRARQLRASASQPNLAPPQGGVIPPMPPLPGYPPSANPGSPYGPSQDPTQNTSGRIRRPRR